MALYLSRAIAVDKEKYKGYGYSCTSIFGWGKYSLFEFD